MLIRPSFFRCSLLHRGWSSSTATCCACGIWTSCSRCRSTTAGSPPHTPVPATLANSLTTRKNGESAVLFPWLDQLLLTRFICRIPENCGHTQARLTTPLAPSDFSKSTHDRLNSGLVVLRPSRSTFDGIVSFLNTDPRVATYKFPDQDLLADFFKDRFLPISYRYNALKTLRYCHAEMWRDEDVKNVHFILKKPWYYTLPESDPDYEVHAWCATLRLLQLLTGLTLALQVVESFRRARGVLGRHAALGRDRSNSQPRAATRRSQLDGGSRSKDEGVISIDCNALRITRPRIRVAN